MSLFLTKLDVSLKNDDSVWVLNKALTYDSDLIGFISVPAGFETDFASVPRLPIAFALYGDKAHREGVIHDYLYRTDSKPLASFMQANRVFLEAMEVRGKPFYIRYPMFLAVCLGGYFAYHEKKVTDKL